LEVVPGSTVIDGALTQCLASGGVAGRVYELNNRVQTSAGRFLSRTIGIRIGPVPA
jgi:hypothetical protein